jgi:hypothetical protein
VEDAALLQLSKQHQALLRWQQQLNPKQPDGNLGSSISNGKAPEGGDKEAAAGASDLPAVPAMSAEQAVLALCGITPDVAAEAYASAMGAGGSSLADATTAALAAALAPKPAPRVATAAEAAAVEADVFGAKGRVLNAQAGARWLMQWCQRMTGAGPADDTIPSAVCRTLLSGAPWRSGALREAQHAVVVAAWGGFVPAPPLRGSLGTGSVVAESASQHQPVVSKKVCVAAGCRAERR